MTPKQQIEAVIEELEMMAKESFEWGKSFKERKSLKASRYSNAQGNAYEKAANRLREILKGKGWE